mgnify:FL=1
MRNDGLIDSELDANHTKWWKNNFTKYFNALIFTEFLILLIFLSYNYIYYSLGEIEFFDIGLLLFYFILVIGFFYFFYRIAHQKDLKRAFPFSIKIKIIVAISTIVLSFLLPIFFLLLFIIYVLSKMHDC